MAAHDIRNLLTAILAGAEILNLTAGSAGAEKSPTRLIRFRPPEIESRRS
jgi:hypothetical protein